jgi:hypothetical protein
VKYHEITKQEIGAGGEDLCIGGKVIPAFRHEPKCWMKMNNGDKKGTLYYISYKEPIKGKCCAEDYKTVRVELKNFDPALMHEIDKDTFEEGIGI